MLSGSTRTPSLPGLSQTLKGLILFELAVLFRTAAAPGVFFRSSGLFPAATPLRPRQPVVPSRRFSTSEEVAASSGLSVLQRSVLSRGMLQPCGADALSSFSSSSWHSCKPGCSVSRVATEVAVLLEIAHPLVTFARGTVLARSPGGPPASSHRLPGISRSRRRQPS